MRAPSEGASRRRHRLLRRQLQDGRVRRLLHLLHHRRGERDGARLHPQKARREARSHRPRVWPNRVHLVPRQEFPPQRGEVPAVLPPRAQHGRLLRRQDQEAVQQARTRGWRRRRRRDRLRQGRRRIRFRGGVRGRERQRGRGRG